jgi:hypothetical protein
MFWIKACCSRIDMAPDGGKTLFLNNCDEKNPAAVLELE